MGDLQPVLRQWMVLRMLSARRYGATVREMAEETGASQKSIRRDLELLQQMGFAIEETKGARGRKSWKCSQANGQPAVSFNLTELASLYLGRRFLEPLAGTDFWQGAHDAFRKIRASLGEEAIRYLEKLAVIVHHTAAGAGDYSRKAEIIDALMIGIEDRRVATITYQSQRTTEPVTYDVHPFGLVFHKHSLYLIAFAPEHDEIRHYKVDRISDVEVDPESLPFTTRPPGFNLREHLAGSFGIFHGRGDVRVRVRFSAKVARYVSEGKWHASQAFSRQRDGGLVAEFRLGAVEEIANWIHSFGPHAVVLEPEWLRQQIVTELRQSLEQYGEDFQPSEPSVRTRTRRKG